MRIEDAPPPGWYPDPEGTSRLRWWEGTDWSDRFRARPLASRFVPDEPTSSSQQGAHRWVPEAPGIGHSQVDTQAVVDQVRMAARAEAERAAQMFGQQARSATRDLQPLITEYTSKISRWFRTASVLVVIAVVLWIAWQFFVQVSLFEWIGDRIDNLTDDGQGTPVQGIVTAWLG